MKPVPARTQREAHVHSCPAKSKPFLPPHLYQATAGLSWVRPPGRRTAANLPYLSCLAITPLRSRMSGRGSCAREARLPGSITVGGSAVVDCRWEAQFFKGLLSYLVGS